MTQKEKDQLVTFFHDQSRWCREADARDRDGNGVHYDAAAAVAWDMVGGICHLFGWSRAGSLFVQIVRRMKGPRQPTCFMPPRIAAMAALQDFNDHRDTTFAIVLAELERLPVSVRKRSVSAPRGALAPTTQ